MPQPNSFSDCGDDLKQLFNLAENFDASAIEQLTNLLQNADPANSDEWQSDIKTFWLDGLVPFATKAIATTPDAARPLVEAMLNARLDTATLRNLCEAYVRNDFPEYDNLEGLLEALGLKQQDVALDKIARTWRVFTATKVGSFCYDQRQGIGSITFIDSGINSIKICGADKSKQYPLALRYFLNNAIVVKQDSVVHKWLAKKDQPASMSAAELEELVRSSVVSTIQLPAKLSLARALLVPRILSDVQLKNLTSGSAKRSQTAAAKDSDASSQNDWLGARNIQELCERLKNTTNFTVSKPESLKHILSLLEKAVQRAEDASFFVQSLATIYEHRNEYPEWMETTIKTLSDKALIWQDNQLFFETSDKLLAKKALPWFQVTRQAMGTEYLVNITLELPYKLWAHTEKSLETPEEHALLASKVTSVLNIAGRSTADMLYWLWKSKNTELKKTYITNVPLLFKTLLKDPKGSYLKAHKDLRNLLTTDVPFIMYIISGGSVTNPKDFKPKDIVANPEHFNSLVRCARNMTLFTNSERQSFLTFLVRIVPECISLVEDKPSTEKAPLPRQSSYRSLKLLELALARLVNVLIPQNRHDIGVAREHGDLRENSEYKFAKERQRFLGQRREEIERLLNSNIRQIDYSTVHVNGVVFPGCSIVLAYEDGEEKTYSILGLLDTAIEHNILSFEAPLAKVLLDKKAGAVVQLPDGKSATIREVRPLSNDILDWQKSDPTEDEIIKLIG